MNVVYGLLCRRRRRDPRRRHARRRSSARVTRSTSASAWSTSTSCWSSRSRSPRTSSSACEPATFGGVIDFATARARGRRDLRALRAQGRSGRARHGPVGRHAAARRDPQGALPRGAHPHPRRADRGAHAAGGRRAVRRSCARSSTRASRSCIITHKLEEVMAFADRIVVMRDGRVVGETTPVRDRRGGPRAHDGRPRRRAARREGAVDARATSCSRSRTCTSLDDRKLEAVRGVSLDVQRGRDRRHRRRRRQRPARARRGDRRPAAPDGGHRSRSRARDITHADPRATDRRRRVARPRGPAAPRTRARVRPRREHRARRPRARHRIASTGILDREAMAETAREAHRRLRRPHARPSTCTPATCRAATSRRSCSRASSAATRSCSSRRSRRAGSTSAPSSSCTGGSSRERDAGKGVLLVSMELEEVMSLSDRILVMYEGRIVDGVRRRDGRRGRARLLHDRRRRRASLRPSRLRPSGGRACLTTEDRAREPRARRAPGRTPWRSASRWSSRASTAPSDRDAVHLGRDRDPHRLGHHPAHRARSPVAAFSALFQGAFGAPAGDRRDAAAVDAADLHGSGGGVRLPRGPVQHRRRGPAVHGRSGGGVPRRAAGGPAVVRLASDHHRSAAMLAGAAWAFIPALLKATSGRARGHHDDDVHLHRRATSSRGS